MNLIHRPASLPSPATNFLQSQMFPIMKTGNISCSNHLSTFCRSEFSTSLFPEQPLQNKKVVILKTHFQHTRAQSFDSPLLGSSFGSTSSLPDLETESKSDSQSISRLKKTKSAVWTTSDDVAESVLLSKSMKASSFCNELI